MSAELQRAFDGHLPTDDSPDAADECTAVRTFFDDDGEGEPTLARQLGLRLPAALAHLATHHPKEDQ